MSTRKRRKYTDDFRAEAVKLVVNNGYSMTEAARNLGINANLLGRWKRQLTAVEEPTPQPSERDAELRRLREDVRRLKMEQDILVKAAVGVPRHFFARESNPGIGSSSKSLGQ